VFREIHPVGSRPSHGPDPLERMQVHAHAGLRRELTRLLRTQRFDMVCLEHLESLLLIDSIAQTPPVLLSLHDAGRDLPDPVAELVRQRLHRLAALVLTTPQDLGYWGHPHEVLVENGVRLQPSVSASPAAGPLLMVAPLRYRPNLDGLRCFLAEAWPAVLAARPSQRLVVTGGPRALAFLEGEPLPPGVTLLDHYVDPTPYYQACSLAINPQQIIEGSALKVAEGLAHGRIVLSTVGGVRGFERLQSPALVRVTSMSAMPATILRLLADVPARHALEAQGPRDVAPWSWKTKALALLGAMEHALRQ
jgi:hypothetical protein